jgi:hypothetical protein
MQSMSEKLEQLWQEQGGRCLYCDGPTYLPSSENKDQARHRLIIEPGCVGSAKLLNHHTATVDRASGKMACKFCNCQKGSRSFEKHRKFMQRRVATEEHPVNRLVETYEEGRLSWRPLGFAEQSA